MEIQVIQSKIKMKQIFVTGGGSKSDLVMQITADILNVKTVRAKIEESSALGAAILTAIGLKYIKTMMKQ